MPINLTIEETPKKSTKRFRAIFRIHKGGDIIKITDFGLKNFKLGTYIDHGSKKSRSAYRARHKSDLLTKDYKRAGFLSMGLLWGEHTDLNKNLKDYKKKYKLD
tara:strand:- start:153 stop:464 length:312 start_codon:yes stop_codon:yes gene_type:complete